MGRKPRIYRPRKTKGRCYELAFSHLIRDERFAEGWRLVHGEGNGELTRILHAWLESDAQVFDPVQQEFFDKADYYARYEIAVHKTYERKEAARAMLDHNHSGPWC